MCLVSVDELPMAEPLLPDPLTGAFLSGTMRALLEMANLAVLKNSGVLKAFGLFSFPS